jgi:hypothetical protein
MMDYPFAFSSKKYNRKMFLILKKITYQHLIVYWRQIKLPENRINILTRALAESCL